MIISRHFSSNNRLIFNLKTEVSALFIISFFASLVFIFMVEIIKSLDKIIFEHSQC